MNKAKSKKEIANEFGICVKTLNKWLTRESINLPKGLISPKDQVVIYRKLGVPKNSDMFP